MQLKAYLLFFEQLIANALAQLSGAGSLFSFAALERTYFAAPVTAPGADAPPDVAPILGAPAADWQESYSAALKALEARHDSVFDRLNASRDMLLDRFGTRLADARLAAVFDREGEDPDVFRSWLADTKRRRLEDLTDGDGRRGIGPIRPRPSRLRWSAPSPAFLAIAGCCASSIISCCARADRQPASAT